MNLVSISALSFPLTALSFLLIAATGCSPNARQIPHVLASTPVAHRDPSPNLSSTTQPPPDVLLASGPITVEQQLDIVSLRSGVIVALPADVDSELQKDQVMARLDARQLEAQRSIAAHKVESLDADLKNWESELQVRETDMRRAEEMHKDGINTQESYDHARYEMTASQYEVERQREEMLGAKADVESIDLELEKTKIVAPFNGIVSQRYVRLGQYVSTGDKLFRVMGTSPLEVRFTLPAAALALVRRGDTVTVSPTPEFQRSISAVVTHISPVVDPGSGTLEVTAVLKDKLPGLIPGTIASIHIASVR